MGKKKSAPGFYAVARGRETGVFTDWESCQSQVSGFSAAAFKKFETRSEAEAFVRDHREAQPRPTDSVALREPMWTTRGSALPSSGTSSAGTTAKRGTKRPHSDATPSASSHGHTCGSRTVPDAHSDDGRAVLRVYTDGASSNNGRRHASAGWGVWWDDSSSSPSSSASTTANAPPRDATSSARARSSLSHLNESRRLPGALQTNNRAELMAIIRAIQLCPDPDARLQIYTDSQYAIKAMTEWQHAWRRNGWRRKPSSRSQRPAAAQPGKSDASASASASASAVLNRDLIRRLEHEMRSRKARPELVYVRGHAGMHGNEMADRLAVAGAALPAVPRSQWEDLEPPPSDGEPDDDEVIVTRVVTETNGRRSLRASAGQVVAERRGAGAGGAGAGRRGASTDGKEAVEEEAQRAWDEAEALLAEEEGDSFLAQVDELERGHADKGHRAAHE